MNGSHCEKILLQGLAVATKAALGGAVPMKTKNRSKIAMERAARSEGTRETKRVFVTLVILQLLIAFSAMAQDRAYVWDGNTMQPVTDTRDLACRKWSIWLLTSYDHTKVPGQQWGNIVGDSEGDVMNQLKNNQEIEDQLKLAPGKVWLTNYNYIGPICNVKPFDPDINDALDELEGLSRRLNGGYSMIRRLWPGHKSELEEQMTQLLENIQRANKLRNDLLQRNRSAMMTINQQLDEMMHSTQSLETKSQLITLRFGSGGNLAAKPPAGNGWTQQQVNVLGSNISQSIQVNVGQVQVRQTVVNDPNGQGQAYSFSTQSLNPATISVQSQGAVWVVSLRSTSRNVSMQITNGGGGVTNEVVSTIQLYFSSQAQAQAAAQSFSQLAGH
jgi:hypothetical protein